MQLNWLIRAVSLEEGLLSSRINKKQATVKYMLIYCNRQDLIHNWGDHATIKTLTVIINTHMCTCTITNITIIKINKTYNKAKQFNHLLTTMISTPLLNPKTIERTRKICSIAYNCLQCCSIWVQTVPEQLNKLRAQQTKWLQILKVEWSARVTEASDIKTIRQATLWMLRRKAT